MTEESASTERSHNLWAPWRLEYIHALSEPQGGCFLCRYREEPGRDRENLVLWRGERTLTLLNRFPYTGGHSMVAPLAHLGDLADLDDATLLETMSMVRDARRVLAKAVGAEGFNIGINVGRCAGAGLPSHLHVHIVPRWGGDTNFMSVLGDVRVIPQSLDALYDALRQAAAGLRLPSSAAK